MDSIKIYVFIIMNYDFASIKKWNAEKQTVDAPAENIALQFVPTGTQVAYLYAIE